MSEMMTVLTDYIESHNTIFLSGGAGGADRHFGLYAKNNEIPYIHLIFRGHNSKEDNLLELTLDMLNSTDVLSALHKANTKLGRKIPYCASYVYKLLARNYYQIVRADKVYALAKLTSPTTIDGGTAWAIQM